MSHVEDVTRHLPHGLAIVEPDAGMLRSGFENPGIDERDVSLDEEFGEPGRVFDPHHDDTVHAAGDERPDLPGLIREIVVRIGHQGRVVRRRETGLERLYARREGRDVEGRHDEPQGIGPSRHQRPGVGVRHIFEFLDGRTDPSAQCRTDRLG